MARKTQLRYTIFSTKWGYFGLAATGQGLVRSHLPWPKPQLIEATLVQGFENPVYDRHLFDKLQQQIKVYFKGAHTAFPREIPLVLKQLTPFAQDILRACRGVTFGQTITYGQLAQKAGYPTASRAIGSALGKNPLPLIIPCHRVICSNGRIGGFSARGGTKLKKKLLQLEEAVFLSAER